MGAAVASSDSAKTGSAEKPGQGAFESHFFRLSAATAAAPAPSVATNLESVSSFALNGFLVPASHVSLEPSAAVAKMAENSNASANFGQDEKVQESSQRSAAWQAVTEEFMVNDLAKSALNSSDGSSIAAMVSNRLQAQSPEAGFTNLMLPSNALSNETQTISDSDQDWFLVNEFSVETTAGVATKAASLEGDLQTGLPAVAMNRVATADAVERPVLQKDQSVTAGSGAVTSVAIVNSSNPHDSVGLVEEVARAVTQQLEEETVGGVTTVRIQLERQDLGSISLFLSINNNKVSVRIVAEDELARQIIDSQMDELRQSLEESGVECSEFQVVCDSTHDQPPGRRRSTQPLISLGIPRGSRRSDLTGEPQQLTTKHDRFNFVV